MRRQLLATKSIEQLCGHAKTNADLKRTLGWPGLILLGIGAIIGAGLFVRTAAAAANNAGPAVTLGFVIAAVGCAFAGFCYAEFASLIPVAGSAYTYAYATMGELMAWIIGWDLVLEYAIASCAVAHGWSHYLQAFLALFGVALPPALSIDPLSATPEVLATAWRLGSVPIVFDLP